jgi:hypothetical protein
MGCEDTAPRILNLDNNYTTAVCFTHQSFVTGGSKRKTEENEEEKRKKKVNSYKEQDGRLVRLTTFFKQAE